MYILHLDLFLHYFLFALQVLKLSVFINTSLLSLPVQVFSILTLQLVFTFSVVCVFTFSSVVKEAVQKNIWAYISSFIIFVVVATTLSFCKSLSRRHPWNIVALVGHKCGSINIYTAADITRAQQIYWINIFYYGIKEASKLDVEHCHLTWLHNSENTVYCVAAELNVAQ